MSRILIITEKPSVTKPMAEAMGWIKTSKGFEGKLNGNDVIVTNARGHLLTMQSPDLVDPDLGWNNPRGLSPTPRNVPVVPSLEQDDKKNWVEKRELGIIGRLLKEVDEVILATDADREGEFIGWLILEHFKWNKPVSRCWLGMGMDELSMRSALANLLPPYEKKALARAAEARARCDWAYMYLVRVLTFYGRRGLLGDHLGRGEGRDSVVSAGRVQSAALYMIYKREMEIRNFVSKTFYTLFGDFSVQGVTLEDAEYRPTVTKEIVDSMPPGIIWEQQGSDEEDKLPKPRFTGKPEVDAFKARLLANASQAKVVSYSEGSRQKKPPITYELEGAKAELSKRCKITADISQAVIEDLYDQGYISYPRTAKGELPHNLYEPRERNGMLNAIKGVPGIGPAVLRAIAIHDGNDKDYKAFKPAVYTNKKLEHHGLVPTTRVVDASALMRMNPRKMVNNRIQHTTQHMAEAYTFIAESYLKAHLPPAMFATQRIEFMVPTQDIMGEPTSKFVANSSRVVDAGFYGIMSLPIPDATNLPKLTNGSPAQVERINAKQGETKQPSRYSETNFGKALQQAAREVDDPELRAYMNNEQDKPEGIGTPATRKEIVPTLKARGYIKADSKNVFFLEPKGQEYIEFQDRFKHHWMYKIETTAEWEGKLSDLAALEDDAKAVEMRDAFVEETLTKIDNYINWINDHFSNSEHKLLPRTASVVTDRMKAAIKSIAEKKGIKLPSGTLSDPAKASAFLNEHSAKRAEGAEGDSSAPSEAQLGYLAKVEAAVGIKAPDEVRADRKLLSDFLDKHKNAMSATPPSAAQISYAKSLAAKLPADKQPPNSVFERMDECRKFIDAQKKASTGSSSGSSSGAKGSARSTSTKKG